MAVDDKSSGTMQNENFKKEFLKNSIERFSQDFTNNQSFMENANEEAIKQ